MLIGAAIVEHAGQEIDRRETRLSSNFECSQSATIVLVAHQALDERVNQIGLVDLDFVDRAPFAHEDVGHHRKGQRVPVGKVQNAFMIRSRHVAEFQKSP